MLNISPGRMRGLNESGALAVFVFMSSLLGLYFLYSFGLSGPYLFDDNWNLARLYSHVSDGLTLQGFWMSITDGAAGPLGRPVSLASFYLNDFAVSPDPEGFKQTNLLIHLLNCCLLAWVSLRICLALGLDKERATVAAVTSALAWGVAVTHVSAVLYVIQRMALLSTTFTFAGLLCFLIGRLRIHNGRLLSGAVAVGPLVALCWALAALSKENGLMLPISLLALEVTIFSRKPYWPRLYTGPKRLFYLAYYYCCLWGGLVLFIVGVLLSSDRYSPQIYTSREFTLLERLYTEPMVLLSYLQKLIVPNPATQGLLYDNFPVATGLLSPPAALLSVAALLLAFFMALGFRKILPVCSFSVLFFFINHFFESSIFPLEIYFEHRNYMPSAFLFLGPVLLLVSSNSKWWKRLAWFGFICWFFLQATFLQMRASNWGNNIRLAVNWYETNPSSERTVAFVINQYSAAGLHDKIWEVLSRSMTDVPQNFRLSALRLWALCIYTRPQGEVDEFLDEVESTFRHGKIKSLLRNENMSLFDELLRDVMREERNGNCKSLSNEDLRIILRAGLDNDTHLRFHGILRYFHYYIGELSIAAGDTSQGLLHFRELATGYAYPMPLLLAISVLANEGRLREALEIAELYNENMRDTGEKYARATSDQEYQELLLDFDRIVNEIRRDLELVPTGVTDVQRDI